MKIELYKNELKEEWDAFIRKSKNGTFLFCRNFMEYHADRFRDYSLLFYKDDRLVAVLPANISDKVFYTHQGLTYGGLITSEYTTTAHVVEIFQHLVTTLKQQGIQEIIYRAIPHIYHSIPAEEDLYALFLHNAIIVGRNISSALLLDGTLHYSDSRKRGLKKASQHNYNVSETTNYDSFWKILSDNLMKKYQTIPVHTVEEIKYLHDKFPDEIRLFGVYDSSGRMDAGAVLFNTSQVVHAQYTAATAEGKENGAIDVLIDDILSQKWDGQRYFDYGISTENNGLYFNEGLIYQKEGFGARGIVYDIYSLKLCEA